MPERRFSKYVLPVVLLATLFLGGCNEDKLAEMAERAAERQAQQNRDMAQQNQRIAEATKDLISADAQARQGLSTMQKDLRADEAEIGRQRDALETERQNIAAERKLDLLLAPALQDLGVFLVIAAIIGFCWHLLMGLRHEKITDQAVEEFLIQELVSDQPLLLPHFSTPPPVIENHALSRIEDSK